MITLFECWNGGTVQWDRINPPQFVFNFPPRSPEIITFYQLSGRICEVMTQTDWHLNMAGQLCDIPNLPPQEINAFASNMRNTIGLCSYAYSISTRQSIYRIHYHPNCVMGERLYRPCRYV